MVVSQKLSDIVFAELVDECIDPKANDCDPHALCMDNPISYECLCREGYIDMSENPQTRPGRHCVPLVNECNDTRTNDCDRDNADCLDLPGGYTCRCKAGFVDVSPNPTRQPGRKCSKKEVGCANRTKGGEGDCSEFADCVDTVDGFRCRCRSGYVDVSPDAANKPGRVCKLSKLGRDFRLLPNMPLEKICDHIPRNVPHRIACQKKRN